MRKTDFFLLLKIYITLFLFSSPVMAEGTISLSNAWINEAPPTVSILAGYVNISNQSTQEITLLDITSPVFTKIEIHHSRVDADGMAHMEKQTGLPIPAGETIEFKPGGYHLMLFNPDSIQKTGQTIPLDFYFSNGQNYAVEAKIERRSNEQQEHHHNH